MRSLVGIAHQEAPGRTEFGVHVAAPADAVLLKRGQQRIDAVAARGIVRPFAFLGDESGVVDQEVDVREALGDPPDVHAGAVLVGLLAERQALVDGDVADAQAPRFLDHAQAGLVVHEEAAPFRAPLRVGFPRGDVEPFRQPLHVLDIAGLVGVDPSMQVQPVRAFHLLHHGGGRRGFLDGERLVLAGGRHEAEHGEVGVRVQEDVLDELLAAHAAQVVEPGRIGRGAATHVDEAQRPRPFGQGARPGAGRVHEMALHVEDEFVAAERRIRGCRFQRRLLRHFVRRPAPAAGEEGGVHGQQGGCGAAG